MQQKTQSAQVPCAVTTDNQVCFDPLNGDEFLFSIVAGRPVDAALAAAEDISEAVHLILLRMTRAMDDAGEPLLSQELNTLALLGAMSGALLRACRAGVATQSGNAENVSRHEGGAA
ncbi:hypothetical protein [Pseudomonas aeruginosa]|uniref:hypothetical protein n=1 Tax=Pseudomonas aeruginosa TaxID=287 RepID=UPI000F5422A5|nr:hypothetical protein [Pseudomonas aeruginosa]RPN94012.1 hypothetical protein IPC1227_20600 [Pseudomonas aeruginosa]HCL3570209.1 hypothetical protein [Pseudomonas aeruginosa]HEN8459959.1 hypothetical protein [Pseudomonas aeruginosa]HEN8465984.1 hypothetical protein [Pseudomonas aeruginosa]HEN8576916.1 hypothetical protein [Pseudomonas aeruginosa]